MKNTLRITLVLLVLAVTGSAAAPEQSNFDGPGPQCTPTGVCSPGTTISQR